MSSILAPSNALTIYRGTSRSLNITVIKEDEVDSDGNPVPVNISNTRMIFSVKSCFDVKAPLIQKVSDDPTQIIYTNVFAGTAKIFLKPFDTQLMVPGVYNYDVWLLFLATNDRYLIIEPSTFEVKPTVGFILL